LPAKLDSASGTWLGLSPVEAVASFVRFVWIHDLLSTRPSFSVVGAGTHPDYLVSLDGIWVLSWGHRYWGDVWPLPIEQEDCFSRTVENRGGIGKIYPNTIGTISGLDNHQWLPRIAIVGTAAHYQVDRGVFFPARVTASAATGLGKKKDGPILCDDQARNAKGMVLVSLTDVVTFW